MTAQTPRTTVPRNSAPIRALGAGALAVAALGLATTTASATPDAHAPHAYTAAQLSAARAAATADSTITVLGKYFAHAPVRGTVHAAQKGQTTPRVVGRSVTVSSLNPAFVAGEADAPVAKPSFVATDVVSPTGQTATVQTAPTAKGWQVVNIASGTDETDYTAKAHGKGTVFREPQINAWYIVRGDEILPLNTEARAVVGASGTSLAAYYRHVHSAYGHKMPGSSYDKKGMAAWIRRRGFRRRRRTEQVGGDRDTRQVRRDHGDRRQRSHVRQHRDGAPCPRGSRPGKRRLRRPTPAARSLIRLLALLVQ